MRTSNVIVITALAALLVCAVSAQPSAEYLSPSTLVATADGRTLYIALATAKQVAVWDVAGGTTRNVIELPEPPGGLALAPDGATLYVSGIAPSGSVYRVDLKRLQRTGAIAVGHSPGPLAISPDGAVLYVGNRFNNNVSVVDLAAGRETRRIPVLREPAALALTPDGKQLFVANFLPAGSATADVVAAAISVIDTAAGTTTDHISLPNGANAVHGLCLSPDGGFLYAVHSVARYGLPATQLDRGWMNTSALSVIDVTARKLLQTVLLDDVHDGAANPWGVACSADGRWLCVSHAGTHEVSVIDRTAFHAKLAMYPPLNHDMKPAATKALPAAAKTSLPARVETPGIAVANDLTWLTGLRRRVPVQGIGPRGLVLIGNTAYVAEYFTDSLGRVSLPTNEPPAVTSYPLGPRQALTAERRGEMLFFDAQRCFQRWQSCSSCHPDGRAEGLNWDLLNDGVGNPKNVRSLLRADQRRPVMSLGIREKSEQAVHAGFRAIQFAEVSDADEAAVLAYLKSLRPVPSPYLVNGRLSPAAERGKTVFEQAWCASCHAGPLFTDLKSYDIGLGAGPDSRKLFVTSTLVEVWRTAPYLYDGRAVTMLEALTTFNSRDTHGKTSQLTKEQMDDLVEFVLSQ